MNGKTEKKQLIKKSEDFTGWYTDVILKSDLADYAPVKGCMIIKPYGYAIWENIQKVLDAKIKEAGVKNAYFPLLIPESLLKKEKEHVEGFSPELAVVTIGGGKKLKEKLIVRPTSETIIYEMYSQWIKSWRDLPMMMNQWCNVVRWEMRTRPFLRTIEFLWQEGHTCHETHEESLNKVNWALDTYVNLYKDVLAVDGLSGQKSESEKFPGADTTFTFEMMMPDGKALQGCTSHDLGQNFAKVFNISFLDKEGKKKMPWQTSWGLTTRSIGALIMAHGDDSGLVLPPKLAPIQIIIIPIIQSKSDDQDIVKAVQELKDILKDYRVEADFRKEYSVGWKFNEWELKGVPLRIELGPKEVQEKKVTLARRDNFQKYTFPLGELKEQVGKILEEIQKNLFAKSSLLLNDSISEAVDYKEFKDIIKNKKGFLRAFWCEDPKCEASIKEETKATTRLLPKNTPKEKGKCIYCGKEAERKWIFAQAY